MGRRALPITADFILGETDVNPLESLKSLKWQASPWFMKKSHDKDAISLEVYLDSQLVNKDVYQLRQDYVRSFSQKGRRFGFRYEVRELISVQNPHYLNRNTEHNIFESIGE